jgi:putative colanic acid biosynthesis acetyltransferase WcaF
VTFKTPYENKLSFRNKLGRLLWGLVWTMLFRVSPRSTHFWRRSLLRLFGARISPSAHIYPTVRIFAPWNVTMGDFSCLGDRVDCYSVGPICIGQHATVSQDAALCTATHDYRDVAFPLVVRPIEIANYAWVAARAFVGPGVRVGEGAVVGACCVVLRDVPAWWVVGGNPAQKIRERQMRCPEVGLRTAQP